MSRVVPLKINKGTTFRHKFVWKMESGKAVDITGYSIRSQIRSTVDSPVTLLELSTVNGRIYFGDATKGEFFLYLTAVETAALDWKEGVYDILITNNTDSFRAVIESPVTTEEGVTR